MLHSVLGVNRLQKFQVWPTTSSSLMRTGHVRDTLVHNELQTTCQYHERSLHVSVQK
jgi:hypothetical protein